jgi:hypothetical protein
MEFMVAGSRKRSEVSKALKVGRGTGVYVATYIFRQGTACLPQAGFSRAATDAKNLAVSS